MTSTLVLPPYLTGCEKLVIGVSAGGTDYAVVDIVDSLKNDITGDPVYIGLMDATIAVNAGPAPPAGIVWHLADFVQADGNLWSIRAGLLIGSTVTYLPGVYWVWWKLVDSPTTTIAAATNRLVQIT